MKQHDFLHETREGKGAGGSARALSRRTTIADENSVLLFQVVRFEPKDFRQRRPDGDGWTWSVKGVRRVPYRLPELLEAGDRVVFVVEGEKSVDRLCGLGIPATCSPGGAGKWHHALTEFFKGADVVVVPDRDPQKTHPKTGELLFHDDGRPILPGQDHAQAVAASLYGIAKRVRVLELWHDWTDMPAKADVYDWLNHSGNAEKLYALVEKSPDWSPKRAPREARTLADVHAVFQKWFGKQYDLDAATATIAAAASERLTGDPLWLLLVAGPGGAKTETVQALAGAGAHVTSTIISEGALLSASPRKQRDKKATGGLLRKIGDHGVLVIKDFTSILSADRNTRASVLAAIREIYDGRWERNVGSDGGQTLTWTGRIVLVAAVTTAWDAAHSVVATMGDRFALLRLRTGAGRREASRGAIKNTGTEVGMRQELAAVVGSLIENMATEPYGLSDDQTEQVVRAADLVTLARSAVERDYRGEIEFAHDPEAPTRFAKQLVQLLRGAIAIGVQPDDAMRLVQRCAADSIPPLRRDILLDLAEHPELAGERRAQAHLQAAQHRPPHAGVSAYAGRVGVRRDGRNRQHGQGAHHLPLQPKRRI